MRTSASRLVAPSPAPKRTSRSRSSRGRPAAPDQHERARRILARRYPLGRGGEQESGLARARPADDPQRPSRVGEHAVRRRIPDRLRFGRPGAAHERGSERCGHARDATTRPLTVPRSGTSALLSITRLLVGRARGRIAAVSALNVHVFGPDDGRPVLALHGVTGHALRWAVLAEQLPELRLIAVDLRGHGHSPWTPPWGFEQHVEDALGVLDAHGLERVPVLGHSFGGAIALHLARTAPQRVEQLVLVDPALGLDPQDMLEAADRDLPGRVLPRCGRGAGRARPALGGHPRRTRRRRDRAPPLRRGWPVALPVLDACHRRRLERGVPSGDHAAAGHAHAPAARGQGRLRRPGLGASGCARSWASGSSSRRWTPRTWSTWSSRWRRPPRSGRSWPDR